MDTIVKGKATKIWTTSEGEFGPKWPYQLAITNDRTYKGPG